MCAEGAIAFPRSPGSRLREEPIGGLLVLRDVTAARKADLAIDEDHPVRFELEKALEQVRRIVEITRKLRKITDYRTKDYLNGKILDIDPSAGKKEPDPTF